MHLDAENLAVFAIVTLAAGYLGQRAWRVLAGKRRGCGTCAHCPTQAPNDPQVVSVEGLVDSLRGKAQ